MSVGLISDRLRFHTENEGSDECILRASGRHPTHPSSPSSGGSSKRHVLGSERCGQSISRASRLHPNVWVPSVEASFLRGLDHSDRRVDCDAATRNLDASTFGNEGIGRRQLEEAHAVIGALWLCLVCARVCACACLSARRESYCAERVWDSCAEFIGIPLRLLLALKGCFEEVGFCGRQGLPVRIVTVSHFLERFGFLDRLGFRSFLAFCSYGRIASSCHSRA